MLGGFVLICETGDCLFSTVEFLSLPLQTVKVISVVSRIAIVTVSPEIIFRVFINDSNDSTNVYIINGLMESILNNLQKIGDQILLNIQMIEAPGDRHLWGEQYSREAKDIFKLQMEVAKNIANEIQAIITPEEEERINKAPTDDLVAYDHFLKGLDLLH
jgi:TolB-like protein